VSVELPADVEPFLTEGYGQLHDPCVYALRLTRPDDPARAWDQQYDVRPEWFPRFKDAERVVYVGATADCLSRLEDHAAADVRKAALLRICELDRLRNVWFFSDAGRAFERESGIAIEMQNQYKHYYVHQR